MSHIPCNTTSPPTGLPACLPTLQEGVGLAAEHGFYWRPNARSEWQVQDPEARFGWKDIVGPILQVRGGGGWVGE
jgi:trehalose-6-phosphatase